MSPKEVLNHCLFTQETVDGHKSDHDDEADVHTTYNKIGFGQCGLIFDYPAHASVLKLARPHFKDALWNDCLVHQRVYQAVGKHSITCRVPAPYSYVADTNQSWWSAHGRFFFFPSSATSSFFPLPTAVLVSQRIPPLSAPARDALVDLYCPTSLAEGARANPSNRDCLVRLYLGRRRAPDAPLPPNFSLRNYNLCLDQMAALGLPVTLFARRMAEALAVMHWSAFVDGYDVEFVFGGEAAFDYRQRNLLQRTAEELGNLAPGTDIDTALRADCRGASACMWLLDFNLCSRWSEEVVLECPDQVLSQLVLAFFENDPYYPLPLAESALDQGLWAAFQHAYLEKSEFILRESRNYDRMKHLPVQFTEACVAREQQKLTAGLGHGHRDLKG